MSESTAFSLFFFVVCVLVAGFAWFQYAKIRRFGGLAGALVGSPVGRTPCEVQAGDPGLTRVAVKLHTLSGGQPDRRLAVEVSQSVLGVFGSKMVSGLSLDEAESLLELLEEARTRTMPGSR